MCEMDVVYEGRIGSIYIKPNTKEGSLEYTIDEWVYVTALNVSNGRRQKRRLPLRYA